MAEPLFLAAYAAGVAEGGSVLGYYQSLHPKKSTTSNSSLLIPSILYGSLAFPMSAVGESPGPALLALLPTVQISENLIQERGLQSSFQEKASYHPSTESPTDKTTATKKNQLTMIDLARKENRGMLRQQQNASALSTGKSSAWTRYAATLDSRHPTLPTPKAEALRRMRLLLFGAGMATWYWQTCLLDTKEKKSEQGNGRMPDTEKTVTGNNPGGGVALRLVHHDMDDKNGTHNSQYLQQGRLPVLLSASSSVLQPGSRNVMTLENIQKHMDKSWLYHRVHNQNDKPFLLVEMDVSPGLKDAFQSSTQTTKWLDTITFATDYIATTNPGADVFSIVIGSGPANNSAECGRVIYLDILKALESRIDQVLSQMYPIYEEGGELRTSAATSEESSTKQTPDIEAIGNDDSESAVDGSAEQEAATGDLFQSIGLSIRKSIQNSTSRLAKLVSTTRKETRILHVVSDNPGFVTWVGSTLTDYTLVWLDPDTKLGSVENGAVSIVCCTSDELTSRVLKRLAVEDETAKIVAVMDRLWMQNVAQHQLDSLSPKTEIEVLSMEHLQMETFQRVQSLLVESRQEDVLDSTVPFQ